jgi:uncharacterized repeat protein (TIGR01451 family)
MKKYLFILTLLWVCNEAIAQGWQRGLTDTLNPWAAIPAYGGGYLFVGQAGVTKHLGLLKIDEKGTKEWLKNLSDLSLPTGVASSPLSFIKTVDSAYVLFGGCDGDSVFCIKKLDQRGNTLWTKKMPLNHGRVKSYKNDYIVVGKSHPLSATVFLKLNRNGDTVLHKPISLSNFFDFDVQNDGVFLLDYGNNKVLKLDFDGQIVWQKNIALGNTSFWVRNGLQLIRTKDSSYYTGNNDTLLLKISKNGILEWKKYAIYTGYALTPDDGLIGMRYDFDQKYIKIEKIDKNGHLIWRKQLESRPFIFVNNIISSNNGGCLIFGPAFSWQVSSLTAYFIKIDESGQIYPISVEGTIIKDMDKNCQESPADKRFFQCLVAAKNTTTGEEFLASSDTSGRYNFNIDTGQYVISAYPRNNRQLWQSCTPPLSKTFSNINSPINTLNFALSPIADCAAMEVQVTTPVLRRCFNTTYTINYCNRGTLKADNAYITVTLDSLLQFINVSRPISSQTGRTYRFNIGTAIPDECGSFDLTTRVRCGDSTRLGQTLCVEAKIFPDTVCSPSALWSGANIVVSGMCQRDSVMFQVRNTGTAASSQLNSIVIEDEVLFLREPIQLPRNGVFTKKFPANGHTWRMIVNQEPNHPTSTNPTAFVEGCRANSNQPYNTGYALLFPNDDKGLAVDVDCHQIVGSYDPNDKAGYPIGYKSARYIGQNQDIEYLVRFQNTGTDTAFTVVIRDTISEKLDISSIEFGASSHAYEAEIYGKGILKFTFNNILLVDSFKNEPKSHGFVQYRIKQQKDLAFGTQIFNTAYIYFDFNEPVITNKTLHTVGGKEVITAIFDKNEAAFILMKVSPNPFTATALFETPLSINGNFELYDIAGKALRNERFEGTSFSFQRKDLAAGIYIFKIMVNGRPVSIGKLIVQ